MQDTQKEVLDLLYGVDKSNNVVEINAGALSDDLLIDQKWIDYTELPDNHIETVTENTGSMSEDELVAKGFQLTDTGWVKA